MLVVQPKAAVAHGKVMVPLAELDVAAGDRVVALHDRRVERHHDRGMNEVQQVRHSRPKAFDLMRVDPADGLDHLLGVIATVARMQQSGEGALVGGVLIDVGDAQLGLPEKRMLGALEDLALPCHRTHDRLERRAAERAAEGASINVLDHLGQATADGTEVLQPLFPQKPRVVGA